jgi:hypothetical protein
VNCSEVALIFTEMFEQVTESTSTIMASACAITTRIESKSG